MFNILVIVDPQNDFVTGALGSAEAETALQNICDEVYRMYDHIFVTLDTHHKTYLKNTLEGKMLPIEHCIKGSKGWQVADSLKKILDDSTAPVTYVKKLTFSGISLPYKILDALEEKYGQNYETRDMRIYVLGLTTNICVCSNVLLLRAFFPNTEISVIVDGCAGTTPELHEAALQVMESCQIKLIRKSDDEKSFKGVVS